MIVMRMLMCKQLSSMWVMSAQMVLDDRTKLALRQEILLVLS
jgi:hypothetical protein